ncbi:hypothetical protein FRB99_005682 [Tulasnella sp. 403]|nr:hypothetical protein FRB99_005682 [Tulasnella sp. 403]
MEPMLALTDPSGNFAAYRKFYDKVNTSCVPFVGIYLTQLVHYADQYPDTLQVAVPPSSMNTPQVPSSPKSGSSASTGKSTQAPSSHHSQQQLVQTTTHINFTRLFKCAEVIHQMLRHQVRGYRQANPSATAMHPVPDPSSAQGIDLGVENAQVMAYVEIMLNTGGVGMAPPEGLPLMNPSAHVPPALGAEGAGGPSVQLVSHGQVGVVEAWYWQRSSELHDIEVETSDIRRGLEAAGF